MNDTMIYHDIAARTGGAFMLGVVGPVRTGKSTFVKRFMEKMIIPKIENTYMKERTKDELPQSGTGKTIMTAEPKFVPENAININLGDNEELSVRLIDCVGYMVDGAAGQYDENGERMVTTPWFEHEVTLTEAAEMGTHKVIAEHSTIGIVITTDGSVCDIPREQYEEPEERAILELKEIGKPFVVLLNCAAPESESAKLLALEISEKYRVKCLPVNCLRLNEKEITEILCTVLEEFPLKAMGIILPEWLEALPDDNELKSGIYSMLIESAAELVKIKDCTSMLDLISAYDDISNVQIKGKDLAAGNILVNICLPRGVYYRTIAEQTGFEVKNDGDLISTLSELSEVKKDYDKLKLALDSVRTSGYGVVMPDSSQMQLEEPKIVRQGGKYNVKLKASAPAIHMLMTNIETEVTPAIGGETASEDIINFLLQGFDGDVNRIWQSNIFGKSLNDIAEEGLNAKISSLPEGAKAKLQMTLQRIINEGSSGLICILL